MSPPTTQVTELFDSETRNTDITGCDLESWVRLPASERVRALIGHSREAPDQLENRPCVHCWAGSQRTLRNPNAVPSVLNVYTVHGFFCVKLFLLFCFFLANFSVFGIVFPRRRIFVIKKYVFRVFILYFVV